jgi:hypothetical protein
MLVLSHRDIRAQLFHSEPHLGFTVRMITDIHQLPNDVSKALNLGFPYDDFSLFPCGVPTPVL